MFIYALSEHKKREIANLKKSECQKEKKIHIHKNKKKTVGNVSFDIEMGEEVHLYFLLLNLSFF